MSELTIEQLRRVCDPVRDELRGTAELTPIDGIVGQPRAALALQLGLGVLDGGFNIYVAGPSGVGKMSAIRATLASEAARHATPPDLVCVNHVADPTRPLILELPPGRGRTLQRDVAALVAHLRRDVPRAFESDDYTGRREAIISEVTRRRDTALTALDARANAVGYGLQVTATGIALIPTVGGRPLNEAEYQSLPASARDDMLRRREVLEGELKAVLKQIRADERATTERLATLDRQVAAAVVDGAVDDVRDDYADLSAVVAWLDALHHDVLEQLALFRGEAPPAEAGPAAAMLLERAFRSYQVNLLVDNSAATGAPVVVEHHPTYANLFGRIEKESVMGALSTDFTMITAGALQRANGGYLVLPVEELLRNPFSWESLKRALRSRQLQIEEPAEAAGMPSIRTLRPQPITAQVKVVLVGSPLLYQMLYAADDSFAELFKVKAEFETTMPWSVAHREVFQRVLATLCRDGGLRPLDADAVARMLEVALREAGDREQISTRFGALGDLLREADYWAASAGAAQIRGADVLQALEQRVVRNGMARAMLADALRDGRLRVATDGAVVGQVNGLAVLSTGADTFGQPSRISVSVAPGSDGLIDIEREAETGGPSHTRGVLILGGALARRYAVDGPITMSARLVFEQSYGGVDGDSASAAELCALLSALAELPLRQSVALTGSVDQFGNVQAIGGVNEKIEGFFALCQARGLDGRHGVIIPEANVRQLMLDPALVAAVAAGQFHVWAASTIDEAMAVLAGDAAAVLDERVRQRLADYRAVLNTTR
jgi:lon-related putative ATP-dependent protease